MDSIVYLEQGTSMLKRIFLALVVLCLALPASASPMRPVIAEAVSHASMHHEHHGDGQPADHHATSHQCLGCAVPTSGDPVAPLDRDFPAPLDADLVTTALAGMNSGPETPPPRA